MAQGVCDCLGSCPAATGQPLVPIPDGSQPQARCRPLEGRTRPPRRLAIRRRGLLGQVPPERGPATARLAVNGVAAGVAPLLLEERTTA